MHQIGKGYAEQTAQAPVHLEQIQENSTANTEHAVVSGYRQSSATIHSPPCKQMFMLVAEV